MCIGEENKWACGCQERTLDYCRAHKVGLSCDKKYEVLWMDSPCPKHEPDLYLTYTMGFGSRNQTRANEMSTNPGHLPMEFSRGKGLTGLGPSYTTGRLDTMTSVDSLVSDFRETAITATRSPTVRQIGSGSSKRDSRDTATLVSRSPTVRQSGSSRHHESSSSSSHHRRGSDARTMDSPTIKQTGSPILGSHRLGRVGDILADSLKDLRAGGTASSAITSSPRHRADSTASRATRDERPSSSSSRHGGPSHSSHSSHHGSVRDGPTRQTLGGAPGRSNY